MDAIKLCNMANDLNIKILHSYFVGHALFKRFEDEKTGTVLVHEDPRYNAIFETKGIYEFHSEEEARELFEYMKDVIAGERLITDE